MSIRSHNITSSDTALNRNLKKDFDRSHINNQTQSSSASASCNLYAHTSIPYSREHV